MHQCMDMHPISTCTQAEEGLWGWGCFVFVHGEHCVWGMKEGGGGGGGAVINTLDQGLLADWKLDWSSGLTSVAHGL